MTRRAGPARAGPPTADDAGASDVVGSILMVAITVVMAGAFALLLFQFKGPQPEPAVHVALTLNAGTMGWGTGDESIRISHNGGEAMQADRTAVIYRINGAATDLEGAVALGGAFADGNLTIGETWTRTVAMDADDVVYIGLIDRGDTGILLAAANLVPGELPSGVSCAFDASPPTVATWTQVPPDVQGTSITDVVVTAVLEDDCSGVDQTATTTLYYCIVTTPPCASGLMTAAPTAHPSDDTWVGTIPNTVWATNAGKTIEYEFRTMKDTVGNTGTSTPRQTDLVDLFNYVTTHTTVIGSVSNFANAQSASDSGAVSTITEAGTLTWGGVTFLSQSGGSTAWSNTANAGTSNDAWATNAGGSTRQTPKFSIPAPAITGGTVTAVKVNLEVSNSLFLDDTWTVSLCIRSTTTCSAAAATQVGFLHGAIAPFDATRTFDMSLLNPNGAGSAFTWPQLALLDVQVVSGKGVNNNFEGTAYIDHIAIEVTHAGHSANEQYDWTGLPAGTTRTLQLSYSTSGDTFDVYVWNWGTSSYTNRGSLDAGSLSPFTYVLTAAEVSGNAARIQFRDATPAGGTAGTLNIDYARVATV